MRRLLLPPPGVMIDGVSEPASTQLSYAGAYSLTLSTALPALALELHSTYLGHEHTATLAGHLLLAPGQRALRHVTHEPGALPVAGGSRFSPGAPGRGGLLLDHLAELRTALQTTTTAHIRVDVSDRALRRLEGA